MNETNIWRHELFTGLTQLQRAWLSDRIESKTFSSKSSIFNTSDAADKLYFISSGVVLSEVFSGEKNWLITDIYGPGDFFGIEGLAGGKLRGAHARTLRSPAEVVVIPNGALKMLFETNFDLASKVISYISCNTKHVEERIISMTERNALTRFTSFLARMISKCGRFDGKDWYLNSQLTQEEIGAYIGTGRQTVTEILNELKSKNILTYHWGRFKVHRLDQLKKGV